MFKRYFTIIAMFILIVSLASCDDSSDDNKSAQETPVNTQPVGQFKAVFRNLDSEMLADNGTYVYFASYSYGTQIVRYTDFYTDIDNEYVYDNVFKSGSEDSWYDDLSSEYMNRLTVSFGYNSTLGYMTGWTFTNCTAWLNSASEARGVWLYDIEENESINIIFDFSGESVTAVRVQH